MQRLISIFSPRKSSVFEILLLHRPGKNRARSVRTVLFVLIFAVFRERTRLAAFAQLNTNFFLTGHADPPWAFGIQFHDLGNFGFP
jgi:hypothetical protein